MIRLALIPMLSRSAGKPAYSATLNSRAGEPKQRGTKTKVMRLIRKCGIGILTVGLLFTLVNLLYFSRYVGVCYDCFIKWGVPFPFRQSEGFATAPRFLWAGLMEDFALVITVAVLAVFARSALGAKEGQR